MSRWTTGRIAALGVGLVVGGMLRAAPVAAESCAVADCDFQVERTLIRENLWQGPCGQALIARLDRKYHGDVGVRAPLHFVRGVCLFERISRGMEALDKPDEGGTKPVTRAIDELQKAQSTAMLPAQRSAAALFEGLMHCKQLDVIAESQRGSTRDARREERCVHRSMAKASFTRVDLAGLDIRYVEPASRARFDQSIEAMVGCQATHLHDGAASACGALITPSRRQLEEVGGRAANEVLPRYFGAVPDQPDGKQLVPPVSALLSRKVDEAKRAGDGSREAYAKLRARNDQLIKNYGTLQERLCEDKPSCPTALVGQLRERYGDALVQADKYAKLIERFKGGLFLDENKVDVRAQLAKNESAAQAEIARLAPKLSALSALGTELARLAVDPSGSAAVLRGCKHLFCDIRAGAPIRLDNACSSVDPSISRDPLARWNPLCGKDVEAQAIPGRMGATTASICREVGFDPVMSACND